MKSANGGAISRRRNLMRLITMVDILDLRVARLHYADQALSSESRGPFWRALDRLHSVSQRLSDLKAADSASESFHARPIGSIRGPGPSRSGSTERAVPFAPRLPPSPPPSSHRPTAPAGSEKWERATETRSTREPHAAPHRPARPSKPARASAFYSSSRPVSGSG
jgi:hypothetical protein